MKKLTVLVLALVMVLSLTACGDDTTSNNRNNTPTPTVRPQDNTPPGNDGGNGDSLPEVVPDTQTNELNLPIVAYDTVYIDGAPNDRYKSRMRITAGGVLQSNFDWKYLASEDNNDLYEDWIDIDYDVRSIEHNEDSVVLYIKSDNTLWAWGKGSKGKLGDGTGLDRETPVKILDDVAFAFDFSYKSENGFQGEAFRAVKTDKTVWQWGDGVNFEPVLVAENIVSIDSESPPRYTSYSVMQTSSGTLLRMSDGHQYSSPGVPVYQYGKAGISNKPYIGWWVDEDRVLWYDSRDMYSESPSPVKISDNVNRVYYAKIYPIVFECVFTKTDGSLWGMGTNEKGELGDGTKALRESPIKMSDGPVVNYTGGNVRKYLTSDGEVWVFDENELSYVKSIDNVATISGHWQDPEVITNDGTAIFYFHKWLNADEETRAQYEFEAKIPQTHVFG